MRAVMRMIVIAVAVIGITGFAYLVFGKWIPVVGYSGVFTVLVAVFGIGGLKRIHQEERMVIEFFGKFYGIKKPGLRWVCPFVMKVRAIVSIWEQVLPLFEGENPEKEKEPPPKIDFKNGSAVPKRARAFLKIKNTDGDIYKAVYGVRNWRKSTITLLGNALRSYLNGLTIEEGLEKGKAGYDFIEAIGAVDSKKRDGIISALNNWGLEVLRVTVEDFDLDKSVIGAREEVLKAERKKAAARFEVSQKALMSGGVHAEIVKILRKKNYSKTEADRIASDYVKYFKGVDEDRILDLRFSGGESSGLAAEVAKVVVAVRAAQDLFKGSSPTEKKDKKGGGKQTERKPKEEREKDEVDRGENTDE